VYQQYTGDAVYDVHMHRTLGRSRSMLWCWKGRQQGVGLLSLASFCCSAVLLLTASMHVCGACTHEAFFCAICCMCTRVQRNGLGPAAARMCSLHIRCSVAVVTSSAALAAWFLVVAGRAAGNCR
jgi:hypothetical protein